MTAARRKLLVVLAVLLALASSYTLGRYTTPAKVVTVEHVTNQVQTKVEYRDRIVTQVQVVHDRAEAKKTTVVWSTDTQGKPQVTETVTDLKASESKSNVDKVQDQQRVTTSDTKVDSSTRTTTTYARPSIILGATAGLPLQLSLSSPIYGLSLSHRLVGPLFVGAWANTARQGGVTVQVVF